MGRSRFKRTHTHIHLFELVREDFVRNLAMAGPSKLNAMQRPPLLDIVLPAHMTGSQTMSALIFAI